MVWRIAAASAIGTSHIKMGLPCQDSVGVRLLDAIDGAVLVCVISDGAGSAAYAELGSRTAVNTSIQLISDFFETGGIVSEIEKEVAAGWLTEIQSAITKLAEEAGSTPREFACTLMIAIIATETATFIQVGDGAMVASSEESEEWYYVFWPQHGEFANSTNFVTSRDAAEVMDFENENRQIVDFAAFSDGIENLVLHSATRTVYAPFFNAMLGPVQQLLNPGLDSVLSDGLSKYLNSNSVCERTDDDKSLVLASRKSITIQSASDACPSCTS